MPLPVHKQRGSWFSFVSTYLLFHTVLRQCIKFFMTLSLAGYSRNYQQPDDLWQEAVMTVMTPSGPGNRQDCKRGGGKCSPFVYESVAKYRWASSSFLFHPRASVFVNCAGRTVPKDGYITAKRLQIPAEDRRSQRQRTNVTSWNFVVLGSRPVVITLSPLLMHLIYIHMGPAPLLFRHIFIQNTSCTH